MPAHPTGGLPIADSTCGKEVVNCHQWSQGSLYLRRDAWGRGAHPREKECRCLATWKTPSAPTPWVTWPMKTEYLSQMELLMSVTRVEKLLRCRPVVRMHSGAQRPLILASQAILLQDLEPQIPHRFQVSLRLSQTDANSFLSCSPLIPPSTDCALSSGLDSPGFGMLLEKTKITIDHVY